jgi:mannitol-1-phosphate 5-dehydrogenase
VKAVVIGPGRIGCGLAGTLLKASGSDVVFVARRREVVEHLNRVRKYFVRLVEGTVTTETVVDHVRAVWTDDVNRVAEEIAEAEIIVTAVGAANLPTVAPLITEGLRRREKPANVLAFENLANAGARLREHAERLLPREVIDAHGFSGVVVNRVVTQRLGDPTTDEPFVFIGDPPANTVVDGRTLREPLPAIDGMIVADNYQAWIERKLYTFSAGHAATAYLGYLKGYHYIHTAIRDAEIRDAVLQAMREGQRGLLARYGPAVAGDERDVLDILARFENAALNDPIVRVGRDPRRKLRPKERLVGAARLAERAGLSPTHLSLAVAAALCFCSSQKVAADEVLQEIRLLESQVPQVGGMDGDGRLGNLVAETWARLGEGWHENNPLLSLDGLIWAWRPESAPAPELVGV